jgi:hypothetical protein
MYLIKDKTFQIRNFIFVILLVFLLNSQRTSAAMHVTVPDFSFVSQVINIGLGNDLKLGLIPLDGDGTSAIEIKDPPVNNNGCFLLDVYKNYH